MTYLWVKAFHLIFVITWFACLFYLPRLFVYHSATTDAPSNQRFKVMERKLYKAIMTPSMILSWVFCFILISTLGFQAVSELWLQIKLLLVILLTIYHFYLGNCVRNFSNNQNKNTPKFYRIINEIPTILLIIIVFIVVFKPL